MRLWGGCPSATPSSTRLDCIPGMDDVDATMQDEMDNIEIASVGAILSM